MKTLRNLFITFLLGGLWHGAGWTFIAWGALHGAASVIHRLWSDAGFKMPKALAWLVTFLFVNVTWVFFRALDFSAAVKMLKGMTDIGGLFAVVSASGKLPDISQLLIRGTFSDVLPWLGVFILVAVMAKNSDELAKDPKPSYAWAVFSLIILFLGMPDVQQPSEFLYFNF